MSWIPWDSGARFVCIDCRRYFDTIVQLDAGVRMVTAQVHKESGEWHLCHSLCETMDAGKLSSWLGKIKKWLDDNPNEGMC